MKKIVKWRACIIIVLAILTTGIHSVTGDAKDNGGFVIKKGVLTGYTGTESKIIIPSNVKEIGEFVFYENKQIEEVTIPGSCKVIGMNAFYNCDNLKTVTMEDGVKTIKTGAFQYSKRLSSVIIPDSVETIDTDLRFTPWLENDKREFMIEGDGILLDYKGNESKVTLPLEVKEISQNAFADTREFLTEIVMNEGLKKIDQVAFNNFYKLENITIPSSVDYIGEGALQLTLWMKNKKDDFIVEGNGILIKYKGSNTKVVIPNNIKTIIKDAFYYNKKIQEVVLNNKITKIDDFSFTGCKSLKKINLPSGIKSIGTSAFAQTAITSIYIPAKTSVIEKYAFNNCKKLVKVKFAINNKIKEIKESTFNGCVKLKSINLPKTVTKIDELAFDRCYSLKSIPKPNKK